MSKRLIFNFLIFLALVAGGILAFKLFSKSKEEVRRNPTRNTTRKVITRTVENTSIEASIPITGKLTAFDKVEIFAEVSGVLMPNSSGFREGNTYRKGEVLLAIDSDVPYQNLQSQKSTLLNAITLIMPDLKLDYPESFPAWQQYLDEFDMNKPLTPLPEPKNDKEKYFITGRNIYNQYYAIKSQEAQLDKYIIRAPFHGVVTESNIKPGTLVRVGQKLGEFISTRIYEMAAAVSLQDIEFIDIGDQVKLSSNDVAHTWTGTVKRRNSRIDPTTQSATIYIHVAGPELKEGMYLYGNISGGEIKEAIEVPRKYVMNDSLLYVVQDSVLQLHTVKVVKYTESTAIVKGLPDGLVLLDESLPNASEGMRVSQYQGS